MLSSLLANPVFGGVVAGALTSALLYQVRALPKFSYEWLLKRLSVTLVIDSNEDLFERLAIYLSDSPFVGRARWLRMANLYDDDEQRWIWRACFGFGWHIFRDGGHWFLLHRTIEHEGKGLVPQRRETFTVRTFGASQAPIRGLMKRAELVFRNSPALPVYVWHKETYLLADRKPPRALETIFLPAEQKTRILGDLTRFLGARELYRRRGTPYRRGYLFEGPPGTGKTTLAFALACVARRSVYMINLNTAGGDTGLQAAFSVAEPGAVFVIEDIDTATIARERNGSEGAADIKVEPDKVVSLAGLLNAIDGLASRENRILVVTSNHADRLDAALLRPGRIDVRETIGLLGREEAIAMTEAFLGATEPATAFFCGAVGPRLPISPAELQGLLLVEAEKGPLPARVL